MDDESRPVEIRDKTGLRGSYDHPRAAMLALEAMQRDEPGNRDLVIVSMDRIAGPECN